MLTEALLRERIKAITDLEFLQFTEPDDQSEYLRGSRVLNSWIYNRVDGVEDMIHITVPDTQTLVEKKDGISKYTAFNLHVNGWFHAAVRFSVLHNFADTIKQRFGGRYKGPEFPPKRLFRTLDDRSLEERRVRISKFLQALIQHPEIVRNRYVEKSLLDFQIDSYRPTSSSVSLDLYLGDGERVNVKCNVTHSTSELMQIVAKQLGCDFDQFHSSFGLFIGRKREEKGLESTSGDDDCVFDYMSVRLLRNFESPYVSLQLLNQRSAAKGLAYKLIIRKLVWDPRIEETLLDQPVFAKLLYAQARGDFRSGHLPVVKTSTYEKLISLEQVENAVQFVRTCHLLPGYGYEHLAPCLGDHPKPETFCDVIIGRRQLILRYLVNGSKEKSETVFRATRIRVWRISQPPTASDPLIFQFEYLVAKDAFQWITIYTDQAILLSLLLQSIGSEILYEHRNLPLEEQLSLRGEDASHSVAALEQDWKRASVHSNRRDEERETTRRSSIQSTNSKSSAQSSTTNDSTTTSNTNEDPLGVTQIYESFTDVFTTITDVLPVQNEAFNNITDDDL